MRNASYSSLDKLLHRLALGSRSIAEMAFDVDQSVSRYAVADAIGGEHVFVSGLARSGTTILMRRLHESGRFRSLTYRDMPFVLAPTLWGKINGIARANDEPVERAHADGIFISADSPESLDEVFWRVFDGDRYIKDDRLVPHIPDPELVARFQRYVASILNSARSSESRYLSKNNNNILRLGMLSAAFPAAVFLIPFRDPIRHAGSLMQQDRRFVALQNADPFVLTYMNRLAHHEFGKGHRPFVFSDDTMNPYSRDEVDYWLFLWCEVYDRLLDTAPDGAIFVCYEDLCSDPAVWRRLARRCGIEVDAAAEHPFTIGRTGPDATAEPDLLGRAAALYEDLRARSRESLSGDSTDV